MGLDELHLRVLSTASDNNKEKAYAKTGDSIYAVRNWRKESNYTCQLA
jgi:hypothetical protein